MADAGDVIENPATGQQLTFLATARDTAGEVFRAEGAFPPGGFAGVEHIHPHQDEHFEVLADRAAFQVEGREHVLTGAAHDVSAADAHRSATAAATAHVPARAARDLIAGSPRPSVAVQNSEAEAI